jgi:hypothetical protein
LDNPDAGQKIQAIIVAKESDFPKLVRELESDDEAVRFYAIEKLKRETGHTFGYQYFVDEDRRAAAVQQWRAWLKGWEAGLRGNPAK